MTFSRLSDILQRLWDSKKILKIVATLRDRNVECGRGKTTKFPRISLAPNIL